MSLSHSTFDLSEELQPPLEALWKDEEFSDITLFVSCINQDATQEVQRTMKCHKIVLAAGSPELKERMVQAGKDGHPGWVSVVREDWKSFVALLGVFYSQKLELTAKNVWGIEQAATDMQVTSVASKCARYIQDNISVKNALPWLLQARKMKNEPIAKRCIDTIAKCFNWTKGRPEFNEISMQSLTDLLKLSTLRAISEYEVLMAVLSWVQYDKETRQECLPKLLELIRFKLLAWEEQDEVKKALCASTKDGGTDEPRTQLLLKGVVSNITLKEISESGWILAYGKPYSSHTSCADLEKIKGEFILVGAARKKDHRVLLCAMGKRETILFRTEGNETTYENGVYWYYNEDRAFGFSPIPSIDLQLADQLDLQGDKRLSWHLHKHHGQASDSGGFRAGSEKGLVGSSEWIKLVFYM